MKKLGAVAVIAASLALIGAGAASAQVLDVSAGDLTAGVFPDDELTALSSSGYPFAVGGGQTPDGQFAFSAHNGPQGPSGYAVIKTAFYKAQGHVVCFGSTTPRVAIFTIEIEKASGALAGVAFVSIGAFDSMQPGGTGDFFNVHASTGPCALLPFSLPGSGPVTQGNIVVKN
jgi:hypothetical protein